MLIRGATGSIGTAAIQIAQYQGADVTAVCSSGGLELVRSLEVSSVILYEKEDFTKRGERFDIIFEAVGVTTKNACHRLLAKNGAYVSVSSGYAAYSDDTDPLFR